MLIHGMPFIVLNYIMSTSIVFCKLIMYHKSELTIRHKILAFDKILLVFDVPFLGNS